MKINFTGRLAAGVLALGLAGNANAQERDEIVAWFDADIAGANYESIPELAGLVVENTRLTGWVVNHEEQFVLVSGVVDTKRGRLLYGAVSDPVVLGPQSTTFVLPGMGRLKSGWDSFDDPLLGFDDPLLGFDDPLLGFDDPLLGFDDPLLGAEGGFRFDPDRFGVRSPLVGIWGTNGASFKPDTTPSQVIGMGARGARSPEQVIKGVLDRYEGSLDGVNRLLIVAPVSLNPKTTVAFGAAVLPLEVDTTRN